MEAGQHALISLLEDFDETHVEYVRAWRSWHKRLERHTPAQTPSRPLYALSAAVLRMHESKRVEGGVIASLSIPWGFSKADDDHSGANEGGYFVDDMVVGVWFEVHATLPEEVSEFPDAAGLGVYAVQEGGSRLSIEPANVMTPEQLVTTGTLPHIRLKRAGTHVITPRRWVGITSCCALIMGYRPLNNGAAVTNRRAGYNPAPR